MSDNISYHIITNNPKIFSAAKLLEMNVNIESEYTDKVDILRTKILHSRRALCRDNVALFNAMVDSMDDHRKTYLYLEIAGDVVGILDFYIYQHPPVYIYISHFCTSNGGGAKMFDEIKKLSMQLGIYQIELFPVNERATEFYVKMGFVEIENKGEYIYKLPEPKEEIILTLAISAHGWEDHLNPFPRESDIGQYYRHNVSVYSTPAVPDMYGITSDRVIEEIMIIAKDNFKFENNRDTRSIINEFKDEFRPEYQKVVSSHQQEEKEDKRIKEPRYLNQASNLITYLSNKEFFFTEIAGITEIIGIIVLDIRQKLTDSHGVITYKRVNLPPSPINLIDKIGVETLIEMLSIRRIDLSLEHIYSLLGFTKTKDKLDKISLVELYTFFKATHIDYVNIFDLSCRNCISRNLSEKEIADIGNSEFFATVNKKAFGLKKKQNKNKSKRKKNKRSSQNKSKSKKQLKS